MRWLVQTIVHCVRGVLLSLRRCSTLSEKRFCWARPTAVSYPKRRVAARNNQAMPGKIHLGDSARTKQTRALARAHAALARSSISVVGEQTASLSRPTGGACHARKPGTNVVVLPRALGSPPRSNGRVTAMPRRPATRPTSLPDNDHLTADQGGHRFAKPVLPRHTPCCWTRLAASDHAREVARGYRMAESGHGEREGVPRTLT